MDKQKLLTRLSQLDHAAQGALETFHSLVGQKSEVLFWLNELDEADNIGVDLLAHNDAKAVQDAVSAVSSFMQSVPGSPSAV